MHTKTYNKKPRFFLFIFSFFISTVLSLTCFVTPSHAETELSPPARFIQNLSDTALMSLTEKGMLRKEREERVRKILKDNFDVTAIARFALGKHWRTTSEKQKKEYLSLFENMVVQTYTTRFEDYSGQTLKVDKSTSSGKRDTLVSSQVIQKDGPPLNLEWRVRKSKKGEQLKIVDVVVEGISMSVTQRSDFSSVIQRGGDDINALLTMLRQRKKEAQKQKS